MRWIAVLLLALVVPMGAAIAAASTPQEAFVDKLGQQAVGVLNDNSVTAGKRHGVFAKMLTDDFDLKTIGHFVLGRHWREASDEQQEKYQQLFSKMIVSVYTARFDNYAGQQFVVKGFTPVDGAPNDTMVHSQILQTDGGPPVAVDWRVRQQDNPNDYKIVDVMVEGVSMSVTQRSEFDSIVAQGGIDGLLTDLQNRVSNGTSSVAPAKKSASRDAE